MISGMPMCSHSRATSALRAIFFRFEIGIAGANGEVRDDGVGAVSHCIFGLGEQTASKFGGFAAAWACPESGPINPGNDSGHYRREQGIEATLDQAEVQQNRIHARISETSDLIGRIFGAGDGTEYERVIEGDHERLAAGSNDPIQPDLFSAIAH